MARLINLDALVPDDVIVAYQGTEYRLPGDLSTKDVFYLMRTYERLGELAREDDGETPPTRDDQEKIIGDAQGELLRLFQIRQPDLEQFPFGFATFGMLLGAILTEYGFLGEAATDDGAEGDARPPARSPRSTGSRPSSKPSRSPRTTG